MKLKFLILIAIIPKTVFGSHPSQSTSLDQLDLNSLPQLSQSLAQFYLPQSPILHYFINKNSSARDDYTLRVDDTVTPECQAQFNEMGSQLLKLLVQGGGTPETWALQMADAWAKIPSGILGGNVADPGDFFECISINFNCIGDHCGIKGKYCSALVIPNVGSAGGFNQAAGSTQKAVSLEELLALMVSNSDLLLPTLGTCFPASCTTDDVGILLSRILSEPTGGAVITYPMNCATDEGMPLRGGDKAMIAILSLIGFLVVVGTVLDFIPKRFSRSVPTSASRPLLAFSLYSNAKKLMSTGSGADNLGCMNGLRFFSICWVILGHTWAAYSAQFNANAVDILSWYKNWTLMPILNASLCVDTFFVMSGALMAYHLLKELDKTKGRLNYPMLVLHRFLRLTPAYMIAIGVMASIVVHFGSGPKWYVMDLLADGCRKHWWHNLLYINNLFNYESPADECYLEGWYLANDFQFFLVAPAVVYCLWRWRLAGYGLLGAFSALSIISTAVIITTENMIPTQNPFLGNENTRYQQKIYNKPWTRCGTYVIGLGLGYLLHLRRKGAPNHPKLATLTVIIGWLACTAAALIVVYGPISYLNPENENIATTAWHSRLYGALHRYLWGLVISWIIYACVNGNGGIVNEFLSWKAFTPLARLSFCMYLCSWHVQLVFALSQNIHPMHVSSYSLTYQFFGHVVTSAFFAFLLSATLESPVIILEKIAFGQGRSGPANAKEQPKSVGDLNGNSEEAGHGRI